MNTSEQVQLAKKIVLETAPEVVSAFAYEDSSRSLQTEKDVLHQFRAHLTQIEDLSSRLTHVLGEVSYTLRKR